MTRLSAVLLTIALSSCDATCVCDVQRDTRQTDVGRHVRRISRGDDTASCIRTYDGVDPEDPDSYTCDLLPSGRRFHCQAWPGSRGAIGCLEWQKERHR